MTTHQIHHNFPDGSNPMVIHHHYHRRQAQPVPYPGQAAPAAQQPAPQQAPAQQQPAPVAQQRPHGRRPWLPAAIIGGAIILLSVIAALVVLCLCSHNATPASAPQPAPVAAATLQPAPSPALAAPAFSNTGNGTGSQQIGTLGHPFGNASFEVPSNGYLVVLGQLKNDGQLWYHVYKPGDDLKNFIGVPDDAEFWQVWGTDHAHLEQELNKLKYENFSNVDALDP